MARVADDPTAKRLRELAAQEAADTKKRLASRTAAARRYAAASARLRLAQAAWEAARAETGEARSKAVEELIDSGMKPAEVAGLLDVEPRELRNLRAPAPKQTAEATGQPTTEADPTSAPARLAG